MKAHMARCNESDRDVTSRCHLYRGSNGVMLCVTHPMAALPTVAEVETCRLCGEAAEVWNWHDDTSAHYVCEAAMQDEYWNQVLWGQREGSRDTLDNPNMAAVTLNALRDRLVK